MLQKPLRWLTIFPNIDLTDFVFDSELTEKDCNKIYMGGKETCIFNKFFIIYYIYFLFSTVFRYFKMFCLCLRIVRSETVYMVMKHIF